MMNKTAGFVWMYHWTIRFRLDCNTNHNDLTIKITSYWNLVSTKTYKQTDYAIKLERFITAVIVAVCNGLYVISITQITSSCEYSMENGDGEY